MGEESLGHVVRVLKNGEWREFRDVMGHQVGYGSVQILFSDGNQVIIGNYDEVEVVLDESQKEAFQEGINRKRMMQKAQASLQDEVGTEGQ